MAKTLLLVEDDITLNTTLKQKLELQGYNVLSATNGQEGLKILTNNPIDLVLLDIIMPKMDGVEMVYHWTQKQKTDIPIIILTNLTEAAIPQKVTKVLLKSNTSLEQILQEIQQHL